MSAESQSQAGDNPNGQNSQDLLLVIAPMAESQVESGESCTDETVDDPGVPGGNSAPSLEDDNEEEKEFDANEAGRLLSAVLNGSIMEAKSLTECLALSHGQIKELSQDQLKEWLKRMQFFLMENIGQSSEIHEAMNDLKGPIVELLQKINGGRKSESELLIVKSHSSLTNHSIEVSKQLVAELTKARDVLAQENDVNILKLQTKDDEIADLKQKINLMEEATKQQPLEATAQPAEDPRPRPSICCTFC